VAYWAGNEAAYIADEIIWVLDGDPLTPKLARDFILGSGLVPMLDQQTELELHPDDADLLVIFSPDWRVLASNDSRAFPPGAFSAPDELPGFKGDAFL